MGVANRPIHANRVQETDNGMTVQIKGSEYDVLNDVYLEPHLLNEIHDLEDLDYPGMLFTERRWVEDGYKKWLANSELTAFLLFAEYSDEYFSEIGWQLLTTVQPHTLPGIRPYISSKSNMYCLATCMVEGVTTSEYLSQDIVPPGGDWESPNSVPGGGYYQKIQLK